MNKKFDVRKIEKLNDPKRIKFQNPETIWSVADVNDPEVVVDIGAGTGFFAIPFIEKMTRGTLYACDIADEMIDWMSSHLAPRFQGKIIPKKMSENAIDLGDGIADLVYMINLHHELDDPAKLLAEIQRILKPGGKLLIVDWKKEETPQGPPLTVRIDEEKTKTQLLDSGYGDVVSHPCLDYHYVIVAKKNPTI